MDTLQIFPTDLWMKNLQHISNVDKILINLVHMMQTSAVQSFKYEVCQFVLYCIFVVDFPN